MQPKEELQCCKKKYIQKKSNEIMFTHSHIKWRKLPRPPITERWNVMILLQWGRSYWGFHILMSRGAQKGMQICVDSASRKFSKRNVTWATMARGIFGADSIFVWNGAQRERCGFCFSRVLCWYWQGFWRCAIIPWGWDTFLVFSSFLGS